MKTSPVRFVYVEGLARLFQLRQQDDPISITAFLVGTTLCSFRNQQTGRCDPTVAAIRCRCGIMRKNTVLAALRELEAAGFVGVERTRGRRSQYQIPVAESATTTSGGKRHHHQWRKAPPGTKTVKEEKGKKGGTGPHCPGAEVAT